MSNRGYKIEQTYKDTAPTVLVTVGAVSRQAPWGDDHGGHPFVYEDGHLTVSRRKGLLWSLPQEYRCPGWRDLWDALDSIGQCGRRPYVVAARASDLLTISRFWDRVRREEVAIRTPVLVSTGQGGAVPHGPRRHGHPLVINGRPDIIGWSHRGNPYRMVSVSNWADLSITEVARSVQYPLPVTARESDLWESNGWPAYDQAHLIMRYMQRIINWWITNQCGSWKDTPGAAAWSSFLRRGGESGIIRHTDEEVLHLEDRAVFGGRAAVWCFRNVGNTERWSELSDAPPPTRVGFDLPGPVHRYDVRAMYPTLLRDCRYPVRLLRREGRTTIGRLRELCRTNCCVAAVRIRSDRRELPRKVAGESEYPTGQYDTVLTTPELLTAIRLNEVQAVWEIAIYSAGTPFRGWAEWILGLRDRQKIGGNPAGELLVKTLANSFGGRLGRRKVGWTDAPNYIPRAVWGQWSYACGETGQFRMFRSLCNHVQEMEREDCRPGTLGACFAHLTAYGRNMMAMVRSSLPWRSVLWQDTDGIVITDEARPILEASDYYHPNQWGRLRHERTFHNMRFFTPKHYWADGAWVLAGVRDGFEVKDGHLADHMNTLNPVRQAIDPGEGAIYRIVQRMDISAIDPGCEVGADGWSIAPHVWRGADMPQRLYGQQPLWDDDAAGAPPPAPKPTKKRRK